MEKFIFDKVLPMNTEYVKVTDELNSNIAFVSSIMKRYPLDDEKEKVINDILNCVINKGDNCAITVGIKGIVYDEEKNNIINDLIGDELLKRKVIYDKSIVTIRYGTSREIVVGFKNGKVITYKNHGTYYLKTFSLNSYKLITERDRMEEFINLFVENKELSEEIQSITIYNPAHILKMGLVIINIPKNMQKEEMDKLVKEICDIFILINSPKDVMYGSTLEYENNKLSSVEKENFLNCSQDKEGYILRILLDKKIQVQVEMICSILDTLSKEINKYMTKIKSSYDKHHLALENNIINNLNLYIESEKNRYSLKFIKAKPLIMSKAKSYIEYRKSIKIESIKKVVNEAKNIKELDYIVKTAISEANGLSESTICAALKEILEILKNNFQINLEDFKKQFKSLYKSLATLGGRIEGYSFIDEKNQYEEVTRHMWNDPKRINSLLKYDIKQDNYGKFSPYLRGALIGTAIFPVVGTLIGTIVSKLFSSYFTKFLEEYKNDYLKVLEKLNNKVFVQIEANADKVMNDLVNDVINEFEKIIDIYFMQYKELIEIMIERDNNEQIVLKQRIEEMREDLIQLELRRIQLTS